MANQLSKAHDAKKPVEPLKFEYFAGEQRTPEWFEIRRGRITASRLGDWLSISKRDSSPLKARQDYEREIAYERQFGVSYQFFVTPAMQDGIDFENAVAQAYVAATGNMVRECGAYYNDYFCASPDRFVAPKGSNDTDPDNYEGLLEVKVLGDNSFTDVLINGVPEKYLHQIHGQLWASGKKWCDFVAGNINTGKIKVIRVNRIEGYGYDYLERSVREPLSIQEFSSDNLYEWNNAGALETIANEMPFSERQESNEW